MRKFGLGMFAVLILAGAPGPGVADEFFGKLERVDLDSVTLRGPDNSMIVVRVDGGHRRDAAPFLGKTVTVHFQNDRGECRALRFGAAR